MKRLLFFVLIGSYALAMEVPKRELSQEEKEAISGLIHFQQSQEQCQSPKRNSYQITPPDIKKQHREACCRKKRLKWTAQQLRSLRRVLFPDGIENRETVESN